MQKNSHEHAAMVWVNHVRNDLKDTQQSNHTTILPYALWATNGINLPFWMGRSWSLSVGVGVVVSLQFTRSIHWCLLRNWIVERPPKNAKNIWRHLLNFKRCILRIWNSKLTISIPYTSYWWLDLVWTYGHTKNLGSHMVTLPWL